MGEGGFVFVNTTTQYKTSGLSTPKTCHLSIAVGFFADIDAWDRTDVTHTKKKGSGETTCPGASASTRNDAGGSLLPLSRNAVACSDIAT